MLQSTKTLSGSYGKLYNEGEWLTNVFAFDLNIEVDYGDVNRSGTRAKGKKALSYEVSGSLSAYLLSTSFAERVAQITDDTKGAFVTELIATIEDPENPEFGRRKVRVKNVQFTSIPVFNFSYGEISEQELQFVADGYEFIDV